MDGVLVDSGKPHHHSWQVLARRHGIEVSRERFNRTFGRPSRDILRIIWGDRLADDEIQALDNEKEQIYRDLVTGNVPLMPAARELLTDLQDAGYVLAVATSGPRENLELVLREGRLDEFFTATVNGFDIAHGKPAPDCFLLAAERIRLAPRDCVVVEDAPVGVQAGVAAGMPVIALAGTHPADPLTEAGAATTVHNLAEITPDLITRLVSPR
jgi:beta-phosphoglucomutase